MPRKNDLLTVDDPHSFVYDPRMVRRGNPSSSILLIAALVGTGCTQARSPASDNAKAADSATEKNPSKSSHQAAKANESDADPTLSPEEYAAQGVPPIQNPWTVTDYKRAFVAFTAIVNKNPLLLPRSASKHSGAVFRRLVSRENLAMYANRDVPWSIRDASTADMTEGISDISSLYLKAFTDGQNVQREMFELVIHQAHCTALTWTTMDEVATAIYQNDSGYATRIAGLDELQTGTARSFGGMVTMLAELDGAQLPDLLWYVPELTAIAPSLLGRLKPSQQAELQQRIDRLAASDLDPELAKQVKLLSRAAARPAKQVLPR
jgi:hypothetical protein